VFIIKFVSLNERAQGKNCMSNLRTPLFVALAAIFVFGSMPWPETTGNPSNPPSWH